jgi:hypothetical protein
MHASKDNSKDSCLKNKRTPNRTNMQTYASGDDSRNSSIMSLAPDLPRSVARKVEFMDKTSSANTSLNSSAHPSEAHAADPAEDRANRLAAWKEQREHKDPKQRVAGNDD